MSTYDPNSVSTTGHNEITPSIIPISTDPPYVERPSTVSSQEEYTPKSPTYVPSTDEYTSTVDGNRYPAPTDKYPPRDRIPTTGIMGTSYYTSSEQEMPVNPTNSMTSMGNNGVSTMGGGSYQSNDQHMTYDQPRPSNPNAPSKPSYPYPPHNQHNYQESYPMYNYPM